MSIANKTLDQAIDEFEKRGLSFPDKEEAKRFLLLNHQYRLRGYIPSHIRRSKFIPGTTFDDIKEPYLLDRSLRSILLLSTGIIETSLKSSYSHEFADAYGPTAYLDPVHYTNAKKHKEILEKADKQRTNKAKHDPAFAYFDSNGNPIDLPIWQFMELLTISDITNLYVCTADTNIKKLVASSLGLTSKTRDLSLEKIMRRFTYLRNICAHGARLYDFSFPLKAYVSKRQGRLLLKRANGTTDNDCLFAYLLMLKSILPKDDFENLKSKFISLSKEHPTVKMEFYGFPPNWEKIL